MNMADNTFCDSRIKFEVLYFFSYLQNEQNPQASAHPKSAGSQIGEHTTHRSRNKIHHPESSRNEARGSDRYTKIILEIVGRVVVDGQLHTKAIDISDTHDNAAVVGNRVQQNLQTRIYESGEVGLEHTQTRQFRRSRIIEKA